MCCGWGEREMVWANGQSRRGLGASSRDGPRLRRLFALSLMFLVGCALVSLTEAAPAALMDVLHVEEDTPLVRTKRAEEVSFGNVQNEPRVKKSDHVIDGDVEATHDVIKRGAGDVSGEEDDSSSSQVEEMENQETESTGEESNEIKEESEAEKETEEEKEREEEVSEPEDWTPPEDTPEEKLDEDSLQEAFRQGSAGETDRRKKRGATDESLAPILRLKRDREIHPPVKRSVPAKRHLMMTAENMGARDGVLRTRTKRDLSYDELRRLLAGNRRDQQDDRYSYDRLPLQSIEEENEDVEPEETPSDGGYEPSYDYDSGRGSESGAEEYGGESDEEAGEGNDGGEEEFLMPSKREEAIEKEILRYEVVKELLREKEAEEAKEAVLDYLIEAAEERVREAVAEEQKAEQEEEREREEEAEALGRAMAKRYPYTYEPYGGRWGAMVPGAKRSLDRESYERLYRLAQALNDNENDEEEEEEEEEKK